MCRVSTSDEILTRSRMDPNLIEQRSAPESDSVPSVPGPDWQSDPERILISFRTFSALIQNLSEAQ